MLDESLGIDASSYVVASEPERQQFGAERANWRLEVARAMGLLDDESRFAA